MAWPRAILEEEKEVTDASARRATHVTESVISVAGTGLCAENVKESRKGAYVQPGTRVLRTRRASGQGTEKGGKDHAEASVFRSDVFWPQTPAQETATAQDEVLQRVRYPALISIHHLQSARYRALRVRKRHRLRASQSPFNPSREILFESIPFECLSFRLEKCGPLKLAACQTLAAQLDAACVMNSDHSHVMRLTPVFLSDACCYVGPQHSAEPRLFSLLTTKL